MRYSESLRTFYEKADLDDQYEHTWGYVNPVAAAYWRMRDEIISENITSRIDTLNCSLKVLEVGVGHGHELAKFSQLGIHQYHLSGIDLVIERINKAKLSYPCIGFSQQDGTKLAFADASFDIVCQFTCVMHMMSKELQSAMCREMTRVLKPGGMVIWWDIAPIKWRTSVLVRLCMLLAKKRDIRGLFSTGKKIVYEFFSRKSQNAALSNHNSSYLFPISSPEVVQMFQGLRVRVQDVGVDYSIWEYIWNRNRTLAQILWRTGWFYRHCFAIIEKPEK